MLGFTCSLHPQGVLQEREGEEQVVIFHLYLLQIFLK